MKKLLFLLLIGGALFYLFNPNNGERHRNDLRNKADSLRKGDMDSPAQAA